MKDGSVVATERFPPPGYLTLKVVAIDRSLAGQARLTLQGAELAEFGPCRPGAWLRVFIPGPQGDVGRVYSIRAFDRDRHLLQIQVMRRRHGGVRSDWLLEHLQVGECLHVIGPRGGAEPRQDVDWHVMLGDETAVAAIASRLQRLGPEMPVEVRLDVPLPASAYREDPRIHWLSRDIRANAEPSRLWQAVAELPPRSGRGELWIAGEAGLARALECWCREHWAHCELDVRAIGYWQVPSMAND